MKRFIVMLTVVLGLTVMAMAAEDAAGTWKATMETPNGSLTNTFVLKVDAGKITGTISNDMMGSQQISNGKIDGDKVSFSMTSDFGLLAYTGTIKGDTMTLTLTVGDGQFTMSVTATRAKT